MSYLVLSLEGPRWVLYAVKGKLGKGEDLVPGTILDLKSMQEAREEIYNIPLSDEEMKNVVESVYGETPGSGVSDGLSTMTISPGFY